jgi:hypothetical protein
MKPWLRFILKTVLPRGTREQRLRDLSRYRGNSMGLMMRSAYAVVGEYRYHSVQSFNKYLVAAELGVIIFCYGAFTGPRGLFAIIASILIALVFRNAYTHLELLGSDDEPPPRSRYNVDRGGDAVTMMVVLLGTQTLALQYAPSAVLPWPDLVRGTAICAPLISILRISLRPVPDPEPERDASRRSALHVYVRTCVFNILWMLSVYGLIAQDITDDPNSVLDVLRGFVPLATALFIILGGRNGLIRWDTLTTLFRSPEGQKLARFKETLMQPVRPGQVGYGLCVTFEYLLLAELAVSMATGVWPWLSGQTHEGSVIHVAAHLLAFGISVVSWKYLKKANYDAADDLQKAIDAISVHV